MLLGAVQCGSFTLLQPGEGWFRGVRFFFAIIAFRHRLDLDWFPRIRIFGSFAAIGMAGYWISGLWPSSLWGHRPDSGS